MAFIDDATAMIDGLPVASPGVNVGLWRELETLIVNEIADGIDAAMLTDGSNAADPVALPGALTIGGRFGIATSTPAFAAAAGVAGTIAWDASFIYVCTATNTWKRVAIATW